MSFFKSLFGGGTAASQAAPAAQAEHNGFLIEATPYAADGQYQVSGTISKQVDGVRREHKFVRADRFSSKAEAASFCLVKGRQIIDQQGDRMFA
jgi:hypothetical protein